MNVLPPEILCQLCSYITPQEILQLSYCSHYLYFQLQQHPQVDVLIWKPFVQNLFFNHCHSLTSTQYPFRIIYFYFHFLSVHQKPIPYTGSSLCSQLIEFVNEKWNIFDFSLCTFFHEMNFSNTLTVTLCSNKSCVPIQLRIIKLLSPQYVMFQVQYSFSKRITSQETNSFHTIYKFHSTLFEQNIIPSFEEYSLLLNYLIGSIQCKVTLQEFKEFVMLLVDCV